MTEIHKGEKYSITTDGITAEKSDGSDTRKMKYYPERDIAAIAGEIDELTAWQIMADVAAQAQNSKTPISPEHIFIDGDRFVLSEWSASEDARFTAPEGYSPVWALAATTFFVYLGCHVFQGLGGRGQTTTAPIPTLRRRLPELSNLLIRCLDFNPANRPALEEIEKIAKVNVYRLMRNPGYNQPKEKASETTITADELDAYWPEEMC